MKCSGCGLLYIQERPDDEKITQAHKQGKHAGLKELDVTGTFNTGMLEKYRVVLEDLYKEGFDKERSWLDVGCGHGEFITTVHKHSQGKVCVKGSEPNVHKQEAAQKRGLDVGYFDVGSHTEKYDAVSLLNVYSHLPNPPAFLGQLKDLLNPEGEIVIQTGDTANFSAKDHYRPFCLPDHLSFGSEKIVSDILKRLGFEILSVSKYPYFTFKPMAIVREIAKAILPNHQTKIRYYLKPKLYAQTDMYIRAKLLK